jgi:hypothetical protein
VKDIFTRTFVLRLSVSEDEEAPSCYGYQSPAAPKPREECEEVSLFFTACYFWMYTHRAYFWLAVLLLTVL